METIIRIIPILLLFSCVTTKKNVDKTPTDHQSLEIDKGSKKIQPKDLADWRSFFKHPPTELERDILLKQISVKDANLSPDQRLQRAKNYVALGELRKAISDYQYLIRKDDNLDKARLGLVQIYLMKREFVLCERIIQEIKNPNAIEKELAYINGIVALKQGRVAQALELLTDLVNKYPKFIPAYVSIATIYLEKDEISQADFVIKRAGDLVGENAEITNLLGVISMKRNENSRAMKLFQRSSRESETYVPALLNQAALLMREKKYESAEQTIFRALKYEPTHYHAQILLALCHRYQGRLEKAKLVLEQAVAFFPSSGLARYHLGLLMAADFLNPQKAIQLFSEVTQLKDVDARTKHLARVYLDSLK